MNEMLSGYIEDLRDNLLTLNASLIEMQNGQQNAETVNKVFRVAHTIKGNSAAMNFIKTQKVMHAMEDLLQEVRGGFRELSSDLIALIYSCHDFLEDSMEAVQEYESDESMDNTALLARLEALKVGAEKNTPTKPAPPADNAEPLIEKNLIEEKFALEMSQEQWSVILGNIKCGYLPYIISIDLAEDCQMKSVRAWMIFEAVEKEAVIVHSSPARGFSEDGGAGAPVMEGTRIRLAILSDKEISSLLNEIKSGVDVASVELLLPSEDQIRTEMARSDLEQQAAGLARGVSVDLLGIEKQQLNPQVVAGVIKKLEDIVASGVFKKNSLGYKAAYKLSAAMTKAMETGKRILMEEREAIISVCESIEEFIRRPQAAQNPYIANALELTLSQLVESLLSPEKKIGDILTEKGLIAKGDVSDILAIQQGEKGDLKFGQIAVKEQRVSALELMRALKDKSSIEEGEEAHAPAGKAQQAKDTDFIRVPVAKVDSLIDMLGELLVYHSQLIQNAAELSHDSVFSNVLSRTEKLVKEIQSLSMSLRMIELKPTLHRLTRIARDTAADLGKDITVNVVNDETEIDRSAADKLFDPLMHLVRNAVSHGIEENELERVAAGKKAEGQITLSAHSKQGNIYVEVKDDGRGISHKKVLEKARKTGLLPKTVNIARKRSSNSFLPPVFPCRRTSTPFPGGAWA